MSNLSLLKKFKLISSPEFIEILKNSELSVEEHNFLLATHILAIGYNSTGICDGSFSLEYLIYLNFNGKGENSKPQPTPHFAFYTTQNGLIEAQRPSNYSIKIHNSKFPKFRDALSFKKFFIEYFNQYAKDKISNNNFSSNSFNQKLSFRMKPRERFQEIGQISGYKQLIENNPIMDKFLNFIELNNSLKPQLKTFKNKAKI